MACWIALHLPCLALEIASPLTSLPSRIRADVQAGESDTQADTTVVLAQSRVWQASEAAQAAGVQPGMRRGGVLALLPQARFHDRDEAAEALALEALALALLRFGPDVAIAAPQCVLIDVAPSLRLFGGLASLAAQVLESAESLGHRASLGIAATASAATLLARAALAVPSHVDPHAPTSQDMQAAMKSRASRRSIVPVTKSAAGATSSLSSSSSSPSEPLLPPPLTALPAQLDPLPVALLPEAQPWLDWLAQIGCATLSELRALPSAGVRRRCGAALPASLSRAYGEAPEAPAWYRAPPHFEAVLPLPSLTHDVEVLLFGLRRLLAQLTGWLAAGQLATQALTLILEHEPLGRETLEPTRFDIRLAEASAAPAHLLSLCKERLARSPLVAPVLTLRLDVTQTAQHVPQSGSLLPEPGRERQDFVQLMERVAARLGDEHVRRLQVRGDHRPEAAFVSVPYGVNAGANAGMSAEAGATSASNRHLPDTVSALPPRPAWLLDAPQRLSMQQERPWRQGPLQLVSGPERIEAGWWEPGTVTRDYFIAADTTGALLWVFRERPVKGADAAWYLHGLFG
ncbi:Y-family DNA polymerase [Pandoraea commovens]|uniref:DNA polymerase Y family protein n=1 Tax=Pandoraea commovens TaxID=2508289 RepID=A0ABY5QBA8_9BURK|nr:DNA polymerase Y family protein [Pandoraea commovens]UVA78056.1 DNA polymerase Y family protein [Pandoraea commovens]